LPTFDSIEAAVNYVKESITEALGGGVLRAVKNEEASQIKDEVYKAYKPKYYKRRKDMYAPGNIVGSVDGLTLTVYNITPPSDEHMPRFRKNTPAPTTDKDLASVIETGEGYDWYSPGPRPFTQSTVEALAISKEHVIALKKHLRSKGIRVI